MDNLLCKILGHKYSDTVITTKSHNPRYASVSEWKHCERCKITFKTYYGRYPIKLILEHGVLIKNEDFTEKVISQITGGVPNGVPTVPQPFNGG